MKLIILIGVILLAIVLYGIFDKKDTFPGVDTPLTSTITDEEAYYEQTNYCGAENYWATCNYDDVYEDSGK
jgi:ABC-type cobalt transport system substrate-binding protein